MKESFSLLNLFSPWQSSYNNIHNEFIDMLWPQCMGNHENTIIINWNVVILYESFIHIPPTGIIPAPCPVHWRCILNAWLLWWTKTGGTRNLAETLQTDKSRSPSWGLQCCLLRVWSLLFCLGPLLMEVFSARKILGRVWISGSNTVFVFSIVWVIEGPITFKSGEMRCCSIRFLFCR